MKSDALIQLGLTMVTLSLMAVGGAVSILPELHRQVVDLHGWMDGATFANLFAIAQIAPGPNMMVVSLIGLHVAGWPGLVVATLGFVVPCSVLSACVAGLIGRFEGTWQLAAIKAGLIPVALGLFAAGGVVICRLSDHDAAGIGFSVAGAAYALFVNRNPLWVLGGGAVVGGIVAFL